MSWLNKAHTYFGNNYVLQKSTNGWWAFTCPFCNELIDRKKMAVKFTWNLVKCWVCEYRGSIADFVMDTEHISYFEATALINNCKASAIDLELAEQFSRKEVVDVDLPAGYMPIMSGDGILGVRARNYLAGRGFEMDVLDRLGIGYCNLHDADVDYDFFGYIIIPFKHRGLLRYFIGRDYIGQYLRYKNPAAEKFGVGKSELVFNEDALDIYKTVYVQEGWSDAVTIGKNGVSTQGWSLSGIQKNKFMRSECENLVFIPDAGADDRGVSFYYRAIKTAMDFIPVKKKVYVVDLNLIASEGKKDTNSIGRENVMQLVRETEPLTEEKGIELLMN